MPQAAEAIGRDPYLHVLLLGAAKGGKSTCTITSLVAAVGLLLFFLFALLHLFRIGWYVIVRSIRKYL